MRIQIKYKFEQVDMLSSMPKMNWRMKIIHQIPNLPRSLVHEVSFTLWQMANQPRINLALRG
jgi:hypothetical protein